MSKRTRKGYYVKGEFVASGSAADQQFRAELHDASSPSRTARKKASERLQHLGEELVTARKALLAGLPLPDELKEAISAARNITHFGARRRQLQLIGKLMRRLEDDAVDAIRAALGVDGAAVNKSARHREARSK